MFVDGVSYCVYQKSDRIIATLCTYNQPSQQKNKRL